MISKLSIAWQEPQIKTQEKINEIIEVVNDLKDTDVIRNKAQALFPKLKDSQNRFGFETALCLIKEGKKVRRAVWRMHGKDTYMHMIDGELHYLIRGGQYSIVGSDFVLNEFMSDDWEVVK